MSDDTTRPKTAIEELAELDAIEAEEARVAKLGKAEADARQEIANRKIIKDLRARITTPIHRIDAEPGMIIIKRVSAEQYREFLRTVLDEDQRVRANEVISAAAVVHPDADTWDAWCSAYPALLSSVSKAVVVFNGGVVKEKKL